MNAKHRTAWLGFIFCIAVGFALMSAPEEEAAAGGVSGQALGGAVVVCANNATYNPDAGTGALTGPANLAGFANAGPCNTGSSKLVVVNDSATAVFITPRFGTTSANYTALGAKICNVAATCPLGMQWTVEVANAERQVMCVATGATPSVAVHCTK